MNHDKTGGPAFPGIEGADGYGNSSLNSANQVVSHNQGMSLRAYAAIAICAAREANPEDAFKSVDAECKYAVKVADALIAALEAKPETAQ